METSGFRQNGGFWLELGMGLRISVQNLGRWGGCLYSLRLRVMFGLEQVSKGGVRKRGSRVWGWLAGVSSHKMGGGSSVQLE